MLITNIFSRHKKDVYVIEWVEDAHCLGLFINKPMVDKHGNRWYALEDNVYLENCCKLDVCTCLSVVKRFRPKKFRASSRAKAIGKFRKFVESRRRALNDLTCGL